MNTCAQTYGGWLPSVPRTGNTYGPVRVMGWASAAALSAAMAASTGGEFPIEKIPARITHPYSVLPNFISIEITRSPSENLARIRHVLAPAISDLASTFGVSRQAIYNWLNGESISEANAARLADLANAADVLALANVKKKSILLKRKFANGKTLLQVAQSGESATDAAYKLIKIIEREAEQRERLTSRFAGRAVAKATVDFALPASNDNA